jgi:hypothetical protein
MLSKDRPDVDQAGIGIVTLSSAVSVANLISGGDLTVQMFMAQEFAHDDDATPFVTGVVYEDRDGNGKYDAGEGLSGVTVEIVGGNSTTTKTAGGYGMTAPAPGSYTLRASGGALPEAIENPITVGSQNVKSDFAADLPETFELVKSTFKIDFKKRAKGKTDVDSVKLKLIADPDRLPEDLDGVSATVEFGGATFGPFTLSGNTKKGKFKSPSGVTPKVALKIKRKNGTLALKVKKADLMDDLGVVDETSNGTRDVDVTVRIGPSFEAPEEITHDYTSTAGKKAKGLAVR